MAAASAGAMAPASAATSARCSTRAARPAASVLARSRRPASVAASAPARPGLDQGAGRRGRRLGVVVGRLDRRGPPDLGPRDGLDELADLGADRARELRAAGRLAGDPAELVDVAIDRSAPGDQRGNGLAHRGQPAGDGPGRVVLVARRRQPGIRRVGELGAEDLGPAGHLPAIRPGQLAGPGGDPFEQAQVEQVGQDLAAGLGVAGQELGEAALGQEDRPGEAGVVEPDQPLDDRVRLAHPVGAVPVLAPAGLGARIGALDEDLGLAVGGHAAGDPEAFPAGLELEDDRRPRLALADQLADPVTDPLRPPVQDERQRVEDRALARAGRAGDREQVEPLEVDQLRLAEGGEAADLEADRAHPQSSPSRTRASTSSNAASSPGSASTPWVSRS